MISNEKIQFIEFMINSGVLTLVILLLKAEEIHHILLIQVTIKQVLKFQSWVSFMQI